MSATASTTGGKLEGREGDVLLFAGIPYAAAPVGERRLRPPEPHPGWSGVRDATHFGKVSVQRGDVLGAIGQAAPPDSSEDCLFLNVQTPALDDRHRPVLVWIHGGGFVNGTGAIPWYDGANFVRHGDVVVVTINYRLGALGWTHLAHLSPEFAGSGNLGLLDQVAALQWVKDNIAAFGGDPANLTVFGESAGAMSIGALLGAPRAAGLVTRAVLQSGAAHTVTTEAEAAAVADLLVEELGGGGIELLLAVEPERLLDAQQAVSEAVQHGRLGHRGASGLPFAPVVDDVVLPDHPYDAIVGGSAAAVPVIVGTNRDEWRLFSLVARQVSDDEALLRRLGRLVARPEDLAGVYREAFPGVSADDLHNLVMTDRVFRIPAIQLAEAQARHQPDHTFMYLFEVESTAFEGRLGSCHALEIPFVFDNLSKRGVELLTGARPPQQVADAMHGAWLAFAHGGQPRHQSLPEWPPYDSEQRATMHLGALSHVENDPQPSTRAVWSALL